MWVFLLTEIMFFGGMFCAYMIYRIDVSGGLRQHQHAYGRAIWGATNTAVLIVSSLSMALAVRSARMGQQKALQILLLVTIFFGLCFLGVKAIEYHSHWVDNKVPLIAGHWDYSNTKDFPESGAIRQAGPDSVLLLFLHDRLPRRSHDCGRGPDVHHLRDGEEGQIRL